MQWNRGRKISNQSSQASQFLNCDFGSCAEVETTTITQHVPTLPRRWNKRITLTCAIATVILNLLITNSIFILCDSNNHDTPPTKTGSDSSPKAAEHAASEPDSAETNERIYVKLSNEEGVPFNKQLYHKQDIFFRISEPESLRYTFKARPSKIGVPLIKSFENVALVIAEPRDSCRSVINRLEIKGNVALVERGGCTFVEKCVEIERSGGLVMIMYDNDKHNDENYIEMVDDRTARNCSIPAISCLGKDGHMIVQSLLALKLSRAVITLPVNTTAGKRAHPPWLIW